MKQILLFLLSLFSTSVFSYTYTKYIMVGESLSLSISFTAYNSYSTPLPAASDNTIIDITTKPNTNSSSFGGITTIKYSNKITVTGKKTGVSTFRIKYKYNRAYASYSSSSLYSYVEVDDTYIINVVDLTNITIPENLSLALGQQYTFSPQISHPNATTTLTWQSSNPSVATVNSNGVMSAVGVGTATIYCTAHNGVSAQCVVTVNPVLATDVTLNTSSAELTSGENLQLSATVSPSNTTNKNVTWSSTNDAVATVDGDGKVTAVGAGQCNIVASTTDGSNRTAMCQITVPSDVLYVDNAVGVPSGTIVLPIQMNNASAITGLQFELKLPNGMNIAKDGNEKYVTALSERAQDQSISCSQLSNGNYQFVVFSPTSSMLAGNDGAIAFVTLDIGEEMATGEYAIEVKNVELTKTNGESVHHKDMTAKVTLTEAMIGDINGDSRVTITDAVGIVNHVLHRTPSVFITKAADVNGDGKITVSDAVSIVNIVLNK